MRTTRGGKLQRGVVDELGRRILGGRWPAGSLIPAEAELLAELEVSRPTLREALRVLASKGLIESRQKLGTSVPPQSHWNYLDPDILAWLGQGALDDSVGRDIVAFRRLIEPAAAAQAASHGDADAIARLREAFEGMRSSRADSAAYLRADQAFHRAIFDATGNRFVACLGDVVGAVLDFSFSLQRKSLLGSEEGLALHGAVFRAIAAGKAVRAEREMARLIDKAEQELHRTLALGSGRARLKAVTRRAPARG